MSKYSKRSLDRNYHPDLFDWIGERELRTINPAARHIARKFGLSIRHAQVIARLAGLGPEVTR